MTTDEIKKILENALSLDDVHVFTEDNSHFQVIAVSDSFHSLSRVKQQQMVYAPLMDFIASNEIHALSIKAYAPEQWKRERKLLGL